MSTIQDTPYQDPESTREELIEGRRILSPRPTSTHPIAQSALLSALFSAFSRSQGKPGGWWILSEPEVLFGRNKLVPDITGWRRERMPKLPNTSLFELIPDWVCGVVSEGSRKADRKLKPPIYRGAGVNHFWVVEPEIRSLEIYRTGPDGWVQLGVFSDDDLVRAKPFEALEIDLLIIMGRRMR